MNERPFPELPTERLLLSLPGADLAPQMAAYQERNRKHLEAWDPKHPPEFFREAWWRDRLVLNRRNFRDGLGASFVLQLKHDANDAVIGSANISNIVRGVFDACYLGYGIDAEHEGHGLMREALERVIRYAFDDLHLHRIMANYMPHNERSGGLLERLGFVREGVAKDYLRINGAWRDHVLTSLTNSNW